MATEEKRTRVLSWEGCLNARDLGGYPTENGRETCWGTVVRSDSLTPLTEAGRAALIEYGVRPIVDLRTPDEVERYPNPFAEAGTHGTRYTNASFVDPSIDQRSDFTTLANDYKAMLDGFQAGVATIMQTIASAPQGGVLVHCMGGKDRTGLVSALLLELVGVPRDTIAADYALTAECLRPRDEEWLEKGPGERADRERQLATYMPRTDVMLEVLEYLDEQYGGVESYLLHAGLAPQDITRLRERLLPGCSQRA